MFLQIRTIAIGIAVLALGTTIAGADTIRVPADALTIQGAIDTANSGDLILVSDGVYIETLFVDVPDLTIQSANGRDAASIASNPGASVPMLYINAPGVTIGGNGLGFTIHHESNQAKDIVLIGPEATGASGSGINASLRLEGNRIVGNLAHFGLRTTDTVSTASLQIVNNEFEGQQGSAYGCKTAISLGATEVSGAVTRSLAGADLDISGNSIREFSDTAVRITAETHASNIVISQNQIEGADSGALFGLNFEDPVKDASVVTLDGNLLTNLDTSIKAQAFDGDVVAVVTGNTITTRGGRAVDVYTIGNSSSLTFSGNTVSAQLGTFGDICLRFYNVEFGSSLNVNGNSIDANGQYDDAIYVYTVWQDSHATIADNNVRGYRVRGLEVNDYIEQNSTFSVMNNAFEGWEPSGSILGINFPYTIFDDSIVNVSGNTVRGFTLYGIGFGDIYTDATVQCTDNTVIGAQSGSDYGIVVLDIRANKAAAITGNTIGNIRSDDPTAAGIYVHSDSENASMDVIGNTVRAQADGALNGILFDVSRAGGEFLVEGNSVSGFSSASLTFVSDSLETTTAIVRGNLFDGARIGIDVASSLTDATVMEIADNLITGFADAGVRTGGSIRDTSLLIARNEFVGDGTGVQMDGESTDSSDVTIESNCFGLVFKGVRVSLVSELAEIVLRNNDFSGVFGVAIENVNSDAAHALDADANFLAGKALVGQVRADTELATAPDDDGDGIPNCTDACPNTPAGEPVDDDGCALNVDDTPTPQPGADADAGAGDDNPGQSPPPGAPPTDANPCGGGAPTAAAVLPVGLISASRIRRKRRR